MRYSRIFIVLTFLILGGWNYCMGQQSHYVLDKAGYFKSPGADVLVFNNWYSDYFSDSKMSGIEIIHHGKRTVTNGDVRLSNTPEQWDPIPHFISRRIDSSAKRIQAMLSYPKYNFKYTIEAQPMAEGIVVSVHLDKPLPEKLEGRAGFNLEFLPSAYFGKTYLMDHRSGLLPRHPFGQMHKGEMGEFQASAIDAGTRLVMAPEDNKSRITIKSVKGQLSLYDGRNKAQNGWYVVRSLIPANKTGTVIEWKITPNRSSHWTRKPVIEHSQVGYSPDQQKVAVIEQDPRMNHFGKVTLYKILPDGRRVQTLSKQPEIWGKYLRYRYARFDFSSVRELGIYVLEYGDLTTKPFRIARNVYNKNVWQSTLDTYFPVQMDHMYINDRYRVWHGKSHLDDARQAPVNHKHFDLYEQGSDTDSPYQSGEHIPGLNVGGWYDAGDYDIRTQSQYAVVLTLSEAYEDFGIDWDETTVQEANRYVDLHHPDGVPDILQQIEHGTLQLVSQYRAVGHAINGIIVPSIEQYTHMGDGVTQTDNLIYDSSLDSLQTRGNYSGRPDDRWAFTNKTTPLDYGAAAALAAAGRVLKGYNDTLATQSLAIAKRVWNQEHSREPVIFKSGNTTGGPLKSEEMKAAVELLITSNGVKKYARRLNALWPYVKAHFYALGGLAVRAIPFMDASYRQKIRETVHNYDQRLQQLEKQNPYGVPITTGGWGGSGAVLRFARLTYQLHRAFPDLIDASYTLKAIDYLFGTHPANSMSMVSGIGTDSKTKAYGVNRADYTFIPGGVVPGVVVIKPNFPEFKRSWPFLWYENEYVIPEGASYIYVAKAADTLVKGE